MYSFNEHIINITPYVPGKPVKEVERELGISDSIKLASNENAWGFSPLARKAMEEAIKEANIYPDGSSYYLRQRIAEFEKVDLDNIIVGNGSNEVIEIIMRLVLKNGSNVVSSEYAFPIYKIITNICNAEYRATKSKDFAFDVDAIIASCDKNTAIIIVDNPNNPTGTYLGFSEMKRLMDYAELNNIILISDEAYYEYARAKDYSTMMKVWGLYKNLIVTRTFSKAYGLCGLRVGYAMASKEIVKYANIVREPFNVNIVAQHTARIALDDQDFVKMVVKNTHKELDDLYVEFSKLGIKYIPSQGNFVLAEFPERAQDVFNKLLKLGIIVRPVGGKGLERFLRISIGTDVQNKRAIKSMEQIFHDNRC